MLRTIQVGNYVSVQGLLQAELENGKIVVRVGNELFTGKPVVRTVS
ncbi:MAG: hypothetical protein R3D78_09345 [Paracoccaceae bacterium]|jgi:hypothetical protein